ncbi:transporter substrate-binding domain-containing protein [bacterium]|nr:transporter substrate-binding domain-containing protein [bacterium]
MNAPTTALDVYQTGVSQEHANGIVAEIVHRVSERLGINLEMNYAPFARRLAMMKSGRIDIMGGLLKRKDREDYIYFVSTPYVNTSRKIFFVRRGEEHRIKKYEDLYGLTIGTKIHSKYFTRFDKDERLIKEPVPRVGQNFKKLLAGRIDAVIYSYRSGYTKLMEMGITDKVKPAIYFFEGDNPVFIGISKKSPLMGRKSDIEAIIHKMVESGEIQSAIDNFYQYLPKNR